MSITCQYFWELRFMSQKIFTLLLNGQQEQQTFRWSYSNELNQSTEPCANHWYKSYVPEIVKNRRHGSIVWIQLMEYFASQAYHHSHNTMCSIVRCSQVFFANWYVLVIRQILRNSNFEQHFKIFSGKSWSNKCDSFFNSGLIFFDLTFYHRLFPSLDWRYIQSILNRLHQIEEVFQIYLCKSALHENPIVSMDYSEQVIDVVIHIMLIVEHLPQFSTKKLPTELHQ